MFFSSFNIINQFNYSKNCRDLIFNRNSIEPVMIDQECHASEVTFQTVTWAGTRNVPFACLRYLTRNLSVKLTAVTASASTASLNGAPSLLLAASAEQMLTKSVKLKGFH